MYYTLNHAFEKLPAISVNFPQHVRGLATIGGQSVCFSRSRLSRLQVQSCRHADLKMVRMSFSYPCWQ